MSRKIYCKPFTFEIEPTIVFETCSGDDHNYLSIIDDHCGVSFFKEDYEIRRIHIDPHDFVLVFRDILGFEGDESRLSEFFKQNERFSCINFDEFKCPFYNADLVDFLEFGIIDSKDVIEEYFGGLEKFILKWRAYKFVLASMICISKYGENGKILPARIRKEISSEKESQTIINFDVKFAIKECIESLIEVMFRYKIHPYHLFFNASCKASVD